MLTDPKYRIYVLGTIMKWSAHWPIRLNISFLESRLDLRRKPKDRSRPWTPFPLLPAGSLIARGTPFLDQGDPIQHVWMPFVLITTIQLTPAKVYSVCHV